MQYLQETVEVAGSPLVLESDGITLLPGQLRKRQIAGTIPRQPTVCAEKCSFLLTGDELFLGIEHVA